MPKRKTVKTTVTKKNKLKTTKDKLKKEKVDLGKNFFELLIENSNDFILVVNEKGLIKYSSPAFYSMLGFTKSETVGKSAFSFLHPDELPVAKKDYRELLEHPEIIQRVTLRLLHKDGSIRYAFGRRKNLLSNPEVKGIVLNVTNITEQKIAEDKFKKSETLYHDLVETSQDLIWRCDKEGRYIYLNPAWKDTFGYEIEEMLGHKFSDFQTPEYAKRDLKEFTKLLKGGAVKGYETVHIGKIGNKINLSFNAKYIKDEEGNVVGTEGTARDITERKRLEDRLYKSEGLFRGIISSTPDHIIMQDEDLRYTFVINPQLGLREADMIGKTDYNFLKKEDAENLTTV